MTTRFSQFALWFGMCCLLVACSAVPKKKEVWDLYDMPTVRPADNDNYYQAPKGNACQTIGDSPSCGGG